MGDLVLVTVLCALHDHLGVIDDVEAANEKTEHEVGQVVGVPSKEPAEDAIHDHALHQGCQDTPDEEERPSLGEHADGSEACEGGSGV